MGHEWSTTTLGEICDFRAGSVFKTDLQGQSSGKYPFVKVSDMNLRANATRIQDANNWVSEDDVKVLRAKPLPPGTVVFAKIGEALRQNRLRQLMRPTIIDNNMMGAVAHADRVKPQYLYYVLSKFDFSDIAQGTALPYLTIASLSGLPLKIPPMVEQSSIASILSALDERIELNRQMNQTLEAIERAIFEHRKFEENWTEAPLEQACAIYDGPHATPKLVDAGPIFLGISNLDEGSLVLSNVSYVSDEDFIKWTRRVTPTEKDVVFSYETRLGQAALIPEDLKCCLGRRMGLLRPKLGLTEGVILMRGYLAPEFQEVIRQRTIHGSTVDRIPLKEMGQFPIRLPQGEAMRRLAAELVPLRAKLEHNQRTSRTLATLRDTLLPKLISGELRVKTAEKIVEAVA